LYEEAEHSPLQPWGYSNVERYTRELQNVNLESDDIVAFDHTFAALKSYHKTKGKAIFTGAKGKTKEVVSLAIVPTTKLNDVAHLIKKSVRSRTHFGPKVVYTDTMPHGKSFWRDVFGDEVECRLGLFHFMHRIVDTLDNRSGEYWKCLVDLKDSIYRYNQTDFDRLEEALTQGLLSQVGTKYSHEEILEMRLSKVWKSRYDQYLRKEFLSETRMVAKLKDWLSVWREAKDKIGRPVFSRETEKATRNQFEKVRYVLDSENAATYRAEPPSSRSAHGLTKWVSNRPESSLEKFHELLANYANTGCREDLAEALLLRGTAEYNVGQRWKYQNHQKRYNGATPNHPKYLDKTPILLNHANLHWLNTQAREKGFSQPFNDVKTPSDNNGERFLSSYLHDQVERREKQGEIHNMAGCYCIECEENLPGPADVPEDIAIEPNNMPLPSDLAEPPNLRIPNPETTDPTQVSPQASPQAPSQGSAMRDSSVVAPNWVDCCFGWPPFRCSSYQDYLCRKAAGRGVLGRPPHDSWCMKSCPFPTAKFFAK
jgi:hypothetical protein